MPDTLVPATPALAVNSVTKIYRQWQRSGNIKEIFSSLIHPKTKEVVALDNLSLSVYPGEFVAYAGANGAGKSTTIKILSGILQPTTGQVQVLGKNPAQNRVELMSRIGVLFGQRSELWWDYPVIASYEWKKKVWNIDDATYKRMLHTVTEMLGLSDILQTFARELSLGQKMRADLGMLLLHNPEMIFLDEPTLGLDVLAKRQLIAFLKHINQDDKTTILVTSHDMDDLQEMARRIVLLSAGKLAFDGSFEELRRIRKDKAKIKVVTTVPEVPQIEGLEFMERQNGEILYAFDPKAVEMHCILQKLSKIKEIQDVEIHRAPIEEVIANLYKSWQDLEKTS